MSDLRKQSCTWVSFKKPLVGIGYNMDTNISSVTGFGTRLLERRKKRDKGKGRKAST